MTKDERNKRLAQVVIEHVAKLPSHQKPSRVRRHERRRRDRAQPQTGPVTTWGDLWEDGDES